MDHLEKEMIDIVNHRAEEKGHQGGKFESPMAKKKLFTRTDINALTQGVKRVLFALITAATFALAVFCFIVTATATGYLAVLLFLAAIVLTIWTIVLVYAQGIGPTERQGDGK